MEYLLNSPYIYVVGAFVLLSIIYYVVLVPKIKAKYAQKGEIIKESLKGQEISLRKRYFDSLLKPIADAVGTINIIGAVECMQKRTTGDLAKETAINAAGKVMGKLTGIGVEMTDNDDLYYLAITNTHLFYLAFDDEKCIECLAFPLDEIRQIQVGKGNIVDRNLKGGATGAEKLLFSYNGTDHTFFYNKQINYLPDQNRPTNDDYSKIYISVVVPFAEKIASLKG